jgi:hypothetical protein
MKDRIRLVALVAASPLLFTLACGGGGKGSGDGGGTGGASGGFNPGRSLTCAAGGMNNCTDAQLSTYNTCVTNACASSFRTCFGAQYQSGTFSGTCGTWFTCTSACNCGDSACLLACGFPAGDCATCLLSLETCSADCTEPACLSGGGGTGGAGGGGTGGIPGFDGGLPDGFGDGTCADLLGCCNAITNPSSKQQCMTAYTAAMAQGGDAACGLVYSGFRSNELCP